MGKRLKRVLSWALSVVLLCSLIPDMGKNAPVYAASASYTTKVLLTSSYAGLTLSANTIYYITDDTTINNSSAGCYGIYINGTVEIYIPVGKTLTVRGGNGYGSTPGGAGIYLPSSSTLIVTGGGSLVTVGGNASWGSGGYSGGSGGIDTSKNIYDGGACYGGGGGSGGAGGGGAGAGIGTNGGYGGNGGAGGSDTGWRSANDDWDVAGYAGAAGSQGNIASAMGTLYVLGTTSVTATGGSGYASTAYGGSCGTGVYTDAGSGWQHDYSAGNGGGGGGGGTGWYAYCIGCGGQGGGGGAGGASGGIYRVDGGAGRIFRHGTGGYGGQGYWYGSNGSVCTQYDGGGRNEYWCGVHVYSQCYTSGGSSPASVSYGGNIFKDANATIKYGTGYATTANGNYTATSTNPYVPSASLFTLSLYSNGTMLLQKNAAYGATLPAISVPSRTGYTFHGYYTGLNGTGSMLYDSDGSVVKASTTWTDAYGNYIYTSDISLYAYWTANVYTLSLNDEGATSADDTAAIYEKYENGFFTDSSASAYKMSSTVNNIKVPARTGYTFLGYFDAVTGGNQVIDATGYIKSSVANTAFSSSRYLYAHWSANTYKLILNNEGADNPGSIAVYEKYDSGFYLNSACTSRFMLNGYSIRKISIPTKKGYTFAGYYESESSEDSDNKLVIRPNGCVNTSVIANNEYSDENFYDENTRYINLYAHWTENTSAYTISFYPNGGSGSMDSQGLLCNETKNLSACKFVRSGYSFKGWSYSPASAAVAFTDAQSVTGLSYTNGSVIRLYAVWAADDTEKYPYSYYLVNGSFETPDLSTVSWTNTLPYTTAGLGWLTTAKNKMIEIADVKYSASSCNNAYHTKNASDGNQFAELNANSVSSLYQLVSVPEACTMYYGFDHRGRYAADTMELWIGAPDDVNAVLSYYKSSGNSLKGLESADSELYDTYLSIKQISVTDDNSAWKSYSGSLELPESTSAEMFAFVATSASDGNLSSGNLIDNVYFTPTKPVSNYDYTVEATVGGSVDVLKEGVSEGSVVTYGTSYSGTVLKDQEIELAVNEAEGYSYNGALVDGTYYSAQDLACINGSLVWVAGASDSDSVSGTFTSAKKLRLFFPKTLHLILRQMAVCTMIRVLI